MTKKDFFLKTVIAMAGNPKYVYDECLEGGKIIDQATALADTIEGMDREAFDGVKGCMFEDFDEEASTVLCGTLDEIREILGERMPNQETMKDKKK